MTPKARQGKVMHVETGDILNCSLLAPYYDFSTKLFRSKSAEITSIAATTTICFLLTYSSCSATSRSEVNSSGPCNCFIYANIKQVVFVIRA